MSDEIIIEDMVKSENGWVFTVSLNRESHEVLLEKEYWQELTGEEMDPGELIKKSFQFLLEREPADKILKSFNLKVIEKYFPEFEKTIISYL